MTSSTEREPWVVLYDDDCGFCKWILDKILAWDRRHRLRPVAIQSPEGDALLYGIEPEARLDSFHLAAPDGTVRSAGAAMGPLVRLLPGGSPLAWLFDRLPRLTQRGYQWVADNRTRLARIVGVDASCGLRR